ncbi:sorbitol dehydrogenase-like [Andrographis paniculata]|uniref:sorbitol dehydrogenase-like n=1 Tax=Andrographis paniculata TaxID=175694 RepID=UPI0021E7A197|nr:sorbitol dehydrogenase-like [Andrographis paniculata]
MAAKNASAQGFSKEEKENMAVWLVGPRTLQIQPYNLPSLGPEDARIRIKAVGICGTDVHFFKELKMGNYIVKKPIVPGHECAGIVEEVGAGVKHLSPGDRVAIEPSIGCWQCHTCRQGRYNICPELKFFSLPPVNGALANYVVHPAKNCFKLSDTLTFEEGALCEPLSCAIHACRRANISVETNVLVVGAGPIGLLTMLAARAFGSPRILVLDIEDSHLEVAKKLGADGVIKVSINIDEVEKEVEKIKVAMDGKIDVSFDCVGLSKTMLTSLQATSSGGKVCLIGLGHANMSAPLTGNVAAREVDLVGTFCYTNTWPLAIELIRSGKIDVKALITHRFGFSQKEAQEAFETSADDGNAIKVMFNL